MGWDDVSERARARIQRRAMSYRAIFLVQPAAERWSDMAPWWAFWRKSRGGELAPPGEVVLRDLAHYCYAHKPTLKVSQVDQHSDALSMAFAEGRRDVFNRIMGLINLDPDLRDRIEHPRSNDE